MLRFRAQVTATTHVEHKAAADGGPDVRDDVERMTESVLLQVDAEHVASGRLRSKAQSSQHAEPKPEAVPLACECASWACHCEKDCICKMRAETFSGERLGPQSPLAGIADVTPDFQCTCDTTETGGPNPAAGGSIDCDCAEAWCRCERRCACSPKA